MSGADIYFHPDSKEGDALRASLLRGERPSACRKCWREEDAGIRSQRQKANDLWAEEAKAVQEDPQSRPPLRYLDLRLGNECNLACKMCNPYSSRKVIADWPELSRLAPMTGDGIEIDQATLARLQRADGASMDVLERALDTVLLIYFSGGEPLLLARHREVLERVLRSGRAHEIRLKYSTNLTLLPDDVLEAWRGFREIWLNVSLDAIGDLNSYIRPPSDWKKIERNLEKARQSGAQVGIVTTVQTYNVFRLPEVLRFARERNLPVVLNFLHQPRLFSILAMPAFLKARLAEAFAKAEVHPDDSAPLQSVIEFASREDWSKEFDGLRRVTAFHERRSGHRLVTLVPELADAF